MYKKIYIPVDNSDYSNYAINIGISIAEKMDAQATGSHVYSAKLHDKRFKDMEEGLPEPYMEQKRLERSRKVHGSLIGDGLRLISNAYLDVFDKKCEEKGVTSKRKLLEGKNWFEIVKDIRGSHYNLVVIGVRGLGTVNGNSFVGSVCERVIRNVDTDVLVVKNDKMLTDRIVVAVDGSRQSVAALEKAIEMGKLFGTEVEAVSVFDPHYHTVAFKSLVGVLSKEAGEKFRFKDQAQLHDEVIDKGLKKVYESYLDEAAQIGIKNGMHVKTRILAGKPYHEICKYLEEKPASLLVLSRFGAHQTEEAEMGSTTENLLRYAQCNMLLT
jgi:nucleotide-binding universal stress UspA family protein